MLHSGKAADQRIRRCLHLSRPKSLAKSYGSAMFLIAKLPSLRPAKPLLI
jgi:hypothetical protein